jgi:S1-C subfamily serine protease
MASALETLSQSLAGAVESVAAHVAAVQGRPRFSSSGVIWRDGVIVTAAHSIRFEDHIRVTLPDGRTVTADLAGSDPGIDVAVLKAETGKAKALNSGADVRAGDIVLAVGRSAETGTTAQWGIISAVSKEWRTWRGGRIERLLRLDADLHPRSSGAAVVDASGKLLGIATEALSRFSPVVIPAATVERVLEPILTRGFLPRGYLGVGLHPVPLPSEVGRTLKTQAKSGLIVLSLEPNSPAAKAGVLMGDILVAVNGEGVRGTDAIQRYLEPESIGKSLEVQLIRGGELKQVQVQVGERKKD